MHVVNIVSVGLFISWKGRVSLELLESPALNDFGLLPLPFVAFYIDVVVEVESTV